MSARRKSAGLWTRSAAVLLSFLLSPEMPCVGHQLPAVASNTAFCRREQKTQQHSCASGPQSGRFSPCAHFVESAAAIVRIKLFNCSSGTGPVPIS